MGERSLERELDARRQLKREAAPPEVTLEADIALAKSTAKIAALTIRRLHLQYVLVILLLLVGIVFGASKLRTHYANRETQLIGHAELLQEHYDAAAKAESVWRVQALALVDQWRVDTIHTNSIITHATTQIVTVRIPMPNADGTLSEIPMSMIPLAQFNAVVDGCAEERHTCALALAAKDSALAALGLALRFRDSLFVNSEELRRTEKHASAWARVKSGGVGFLAGTAAGAIGTALVCRK